MRVGTSGRIGKEIVRYAAQKFARFLDRNKITTDNLIRHLGDHRIHPKSTDRLIIYGNQCRGSSLTYYLRYEIQDHGPVIQANLRPLAPPQNAGELVVWCFYLWPCFRGETIDSYGNMRQTMPLEEGSINVLRQELEFF